MESSQGRKPAALTLHWRVYLFLSNFNFILLYFICNLIFFVDYLSLKLYYVSCETCIFIIDCNICINFIRILFILVYLIVI